MPDRPKNALDEAAVDPLTGKWNVRVDGAFMKNLNADRLVGETDEEVIRRRVGRAPDTAVVNIAKIGAADPVVETSRVRFIGMDERVDLRNEKVSKFNIIPNKDLSELMGRPVEKDADGKPILSPLEMRTLRAALEVRSLVVDNPRLDDGARRRILEAVRDYPSGPDGTVGGKRFASDMDNVIIGEEVYTEMLEWLSGPLTLGRASGSQMHKLKEAWHAKAVCVPADRDRLRTQIQIDSVEIIDREFHSFVVQHDWAAAFKGAKDFDGGEIALPFEECAFEFHIGGKRVIFLLGSDSGPGEFRSWVCLPVVQMSTGRWCLPWAFNYDGAGLMLLQRRSGGTVADNDMVIAFQKVADLGAAAIRAICISLEAEIATTEVVRANHKLNHQRERKGKLPLLDFHVVSLARRDRPAPLPYVPGTEPAYRVRMHFRRGHWRHYEDHKTWIKWMLVGDPDLGFVDKHYKL